MKTFLIPIPRACEDASVLVLHLTYHSLIHATLLKLQQPHYNATYNVGHDIAIDVRVTREQGNNVLERIDPSNRIMCPLRRHCPSMFVSPRMSTATTSTTTCKGTTAQDM
eukprot:5169205-Amphidinium_carterae.1